MDTFFFHFKNLHWNVVDYKDKDMSAEVMTAVVHRLDTRWCCSILADHSSGFLRHEKKPYCAC